MSGTFSAAALQLAGLVPRVLGWRPGDFWDATPAELAAIFAGGGAPQATPLSRAELDGLMERDGDGR